MRSVIVLSITTSIVFCAPTLAYDWATNPGDGSEANPYQISTPEQLVAIGFSHDAYILMNDIDMDPTVTGIEPFESAVIYPLESGTIFIDGFSGTFDGNGYVIKNVQIDTSDLETRIDYLGLFGSIGWGTVKNLGVENILIVGHLNSINCGGLSGYSCYGTTISNCYTTGSIHAGCYLGGIIGASENIMMDHCYSFCSVKGEGYYRGAPSHSTFIPPRVGGLIGYVGRDAGTVKFCYATGKVEGTGDSGEPVGGLFGTVYNNDGYYLQISDCLWDVQTSETALGVGTSSNPLDGIAGLTTEQMKQQANFPNWDFVGEEVNGLNEIWRMCVDDTDYPRLSWEFAKHGDFACGDGVDLFDLEALASAWLSAEADDPAVFNYACDANGDGVIDLGDYADLGRNW